MFTDIATTRGIAKKEVEKNKKDESRFRVPVQCNRAGTCAQLLAMQRGFAQTEVRVRDDIVGDPARKSMLAAIFDATSRCEFRVCEDKRELVPETFDLTIAGCDTLADHRDRFRIKELTKRRFFCRVDVDRSRRAT